MMKNVLAQNFQKEFELKFSQFFDEYKEKIALINPTALELVQNVQKVTTGGKRIRPILVYLGFSLVKEPNKRDLDNLFFLGIALEIFHTFCLIHDDIIDHSLLRRNIPTIQAVYQQKFKDFGQESTKAEDLATSTAILGGDLAYSLSLKAFNQIQTDNFIDLNELFLQMQLEVSCGQIDDTLGTGITSLDALSEAQILNMLDYKSGRYSIQKPLMLGAALAKSDTKTLQRIEKIGYNLGLIFQLTDDILGVFGQTDTTGKSINSDILDAKRTLLMIKTYNNLPKNLQIKLKNILAKSPNLKISEVDWIKDQMQKTGSLESLQNQCKDLESEATIWLQEYFDKSNWANIEVQNLAKKLLQREK